MVWVHTEVEKLGAKSVLERGVVNMDLYMLS